MPSVVHVVTTSNFAGVENYVANTARETAERGWKVAVVGGDPKRMSEALGDSVDWLPGAGTFRALRSLRRLGRRDICHAHMTIAEAVSLSARPLHRSPVVSTRHFASHRGSSIGGRLVAPWIARGVAREIAVSDFVAQHIERPPDTVLCNGVSPSPCLWKIENRVVLVLQRLEPEKDTWTALRAWQESRLFDEGWTLRVVGDGSERRSLETWVRTGPVEGVEFVGWTSCVTDHLAVAGALLAPAPAEPFGLAVVEAMAAGVPAAASAAGGHLETVGLLDDAPLFTPGDALGAAAALSSLRSDRTRTSLSAAGRQLAQAEFSTAGHVDRLLEVYASIPIPVTAHPSGSQPHEA